MKQTILECFPDPGTEHDLRGLYLSHMLGELARSRHAPYIYANFIASVDGRIALKRPTGKGRMIPKNIPNDRDWRLYQELAAQADLILSTGRYLRDWAVGRAQEILRLDDPEFADLREWRVARGLKPQPDLAILSASLDFPLPGLLTANGRKVVFMTTAKPDLKRVRELETTGPVLVAGKKSIIGGLLKQRIAELGYQTVYSAAGPRVSHLLLAGRVLDRLYLTSANRLLGGEQFDSIVKGPLLKPAVDLKLNTLYYDPVALDGLGQLFASYDLVAAGEK